MKNLRYAAAAAVMLSCAAGAARGSPAAEVPGALGAQLAGQPGLYWKLQFGPSRRPAESHYGFALHHGAQGGAPAPAVLELDVSRSGAQALLAGIPVAGRSFGLAAAADGAGAPADSWYSQQWIWWTAAGLAATAAAVSGASHAASSSDHNTNNGANSGIGTGNIPGNFCVSRGEPPVPDTCTNVPLLPASSPAAALWAQPADALLEDALGGMGDLAPE